MMLRLLSLACLGITLVSPASHAQPQVIGHLEPIQKVIVSSELTAPIKTLHAQLGDNVTAGQTLAELDCSYYQLQKQAASAQLRLDQTVTANNQKKFQRLNNLFQQNNASVTELDDIQRDLEVSQSQLTLDQAKLQQAQLNESKCNIVAPFAGVVSARLSEVGQYLTPGSQLFELTNISQLKVVFYLLEDDLSNVQAGQKITLDIPAADVSARHSRITHIAPLQNPTAPGYRVEALLDNPESEIAAGFTVRINLPTGNSL